MKRHEFKNVEIGDKLVITVQGKNKGKIGIVRIKHTDDAFGGGYVGLEPFECEFEFSDSKIKDRRKERTGFHTWRHEFVNYPCSTEKKDQSLMFKFSGSEEDIKTIMDEINKAVKKIAPDAKVTMHTN